MASQETKPRIPAAQLLTKIFRCPYVEACKQASQPGHACSEIVRTQDSVDFAHHQPPEPWSGQLATAPILFVSSNPSIGNDEFPTFGWKDSSVVDYFDNRFVGGRKPWILNGTRPLLRDGKHDRPVQFWCSVRKCAEVVLGRRPVPGEDYALTEIVHCKSRSERGVRAALGFCSGLYTDRILRASGARIIVSLGRMAESVLSPMCTRAADCRMGVSSSSSGLGKRHFVFLPHPNAREPRTIQRLLTSEQIASLTRILR